MAKAKNPFREALEAAEAESSPAVSAKTTTPTKRAQLRTVAELNLVSKETLRGSPKIAELTVKDLNDLALEFSGVPSKNPVVSELTLEDIQDIESVFYDFKVAAGKDLIQRAGIAGRAGSVDVSCCCCTPCCCCAATDMSHTA
jgi:hypothetical protein